jgi:hypothetical protein
MPASSALSNRSGLSESGTGQTIIGLIRAVVERFVFHKWRSSRHTKEIAMESAEHCRMQAEECRSLLALAQSEAVASVLKNLSRSWVVIANQIERYVELVKKETAQKK